MIGYEKSAQISELKKIEYREIHLKLRKTKERNIYIVKVDAKKGQEEYRKRYDVIGRSAKLKQRSGLITGEGMNAPRHHHRCSRARRSHG